VIDVAGSSTDHAYIPSTHEVPLTVSPSLLKYFSPRGAVAIVFMLYGVVYGVSSAAAPVKPAKAAAASHSRRGSSTGAEGFLTSLRDESNRAHFGTLPATHAATAVRGPVRRSTAPWTSNAPPIAELTSTGPGIRGLAGAWGPSAPVGQMPAAHVDLWTAPRARVAFAVHRGISLQARLAF
jgi:hypothetical protein